MPEKRKRKRGSTTLDHIICEIRCAEIRGLRVGQFFENLRYYIQTKHHRDDLFYVQDDYLLILLRDYLQETSKPGGDNAEKVS